MTPRPGAAYLMTLTIIGLPSATRPGLLDELNGQGFAYRWCTRAICLDKTDAARLFTRIRRQRFAKRKSIAAILKEVMTDEAATLLASDTANTAADPSARRQPGGPPTAAIRKWTRQRRASSLRNAAARVEPRRQGYYNAVQVFPWSEGTL